MLHFSITVTYEVQLDYSYFGCILVSTHAHDNNLQCMINFSHDA